MTKAELQVLVPDNFVKFIDGTDLYRLSKNVEQVPV